MRAFAARYPILFVGLSGLSLILAQYAWLYLVPGVSDSARIVAAKVTECLVAGYLLSSLRWWREAGFVPAWRWRDALPALPLLLVPLLMIISQRDKLHVSSASELLVFGSVAAMTGFAEEAVFRGIALRVLRPAGLVRAAIASAVIFGLLHLINLLRGADPLATLVQVIFATLFGIAFAGPLLYSGSIWPLVVIHGLQDFLAFWTTGGITETKAPSIGDAIGSVVVMLPFAAYGLWLIRHRIGRAAATLPLPPALE